MTTIREANPADLESITSLLAACGLLAAGVLTPGSRYWLAEDGDHVVGAIGLECGSEAGLLRSAGVLPSQRGLGLGAQLTQRLFDAAAAAGLRHLYCFSTGAGDYWQRHGFVEVPVPELVAALPNCFQVQHYAALGWLPTEIAWRKDLRAA
ncbi:MAG: GNAT family N-acetyltransferase [Chloroflexaceae bacterium]|jgi:N-acetylglutamate synthase-like GNAT family acetyltransferase|nr:GNAT family N-acetyltransferase [Chloroflexaceae bacterium]